MMSVPGPSCRLSVQGVNPPVCCVLDDVCKGQFCGFTQCAVSSRGGGPDTLAPAPVLQFDPFGTVWATHRLPCSVILVVVRWAVLRG